ncbi:MarR family winged helix-turn-helix transcriptional regulator [Salinicoccus carnicancri]|uniref:MarR family winged helix-turn-helix transcriptional regulator n=1 Tax=Salinicoccus carnicancri TaxID=558170 RepID=UPI0002D94AB7|nr:winged helix DNA-binding protein [Salinicoccus carnicancri]
MRIEQEFFDAYVALYRPYINRANSILTAYNLYSSQWLILKDIAKHGTTTLADVSRRRQIEKPTANKVIKHLLELGLIQSEQGEDRRVKNLTMTEDGVHLYDEVRKKMDEMQREVLQDVDREQLEAMITNFEKMKI